MKGNKSKTQNNPNDDEKEQAMLMTMVTIVFLAKKLAEATGEPKEKEQALATIKAKEFLKNCSKEQLRKFLELNFLQIIKGDINDEN